MLTQDPIGLAGGVNLYAYAGNNPTSFSDPWGLKGEESCPPCGAAAHGMMVKMAGEYAIYGEGRAEDLYEAYRSGLATVNLITVVGGVLQAGLAMRPASGAVVQRAMSNEELAATEETGLLRGGRDGTHYVSDAVNSNALRARQRLALPQTPDVRVTMRVPSDALSAPTRVPPAYGMPGGGTQRTASGNIPVQVLDILKY